MTRRLIMSILHFQPIKGQVRTILRAILNTPEVSSCRLKVVLTLRLVCEEIVMNVTSYAYPEGTEGYLDVDIQKVAVSRGHPDNRVVIRFEDGGIPFNPLEQKKPDITLPWKQRPVGGLGVYLILRMMDDVRYAYVDNRNILTVEKII